MSITEKRLKKECEKIFEIYKNYTIEFCNDEKEDYYKLTVTINNNKLKFIINTSYPFKRPSLYINDVSYLDLLRIHFPELICYLKKNSIQCLCCKTLLCSNNWKPGIKLLHIVDEYLLTKKIINYNIKKKYIRMICYNFNIFAEEIIDFILNKIMLDPLKN